MFKAHRFLLVVCLMLLAASAQAQKPPLRPEGALPIVYDDVTTGATSLDRAAAKAYSGKFKIVEVTTQQDYKPGYLKGREISYGDFRPMRQRATPARVTFLFIVTPQGRAIEPRVIESTDQTITDSILDGIEHWRFAPARFQGVPVARLSSFQQKFGGSKRDGNGIGGDGLGIQGYRDR